VLFENSNVFVFELFPREVRISENQLLLSDSIIFEERWGEQRGRERGGGRAVGMRRERAWTRLLDDWDASASC
jgi:hypothetical protein